jgi:hypothetical protein
VQLGCVFEEHLSVSSQVFAVEHRRLEIVLLE